MINPTELQIKQLDGTFEKFLIGHANNYLLQYGRNFAPGEHEYLVYKSNPITGFSIAVQKKKGNLFIIHVNCNSPDCEKKNIVFEALCFISSQWKSPIYSSLKEGYFNDDEYDRIVPETMGVRWEKMLERYPNRVKFLEDKGRYVFLLAQS